MSTKNCSYEIRTLMYNYSYICFGFLICENNYLYFIGTIHFALINNIYLIEEIVPTDKYNIINDNYEEINALIENNYIEKINHNKFKYKIGSRTILELI